MEKSNVSMTKIALIIAILYIYIVPSYTFDGIALPFSSYLFALFLLSCLLLALVEKVTISPVEIILCVLMVVCGIYQRSFSIVVVLSPLICRIVFSGESRNEVLSFLVKSKWIHIALIFTIFYSIVYFHLDGRVAHAAIFEVNVSGYAILMLGLIYLRRNRIIGLLVLLFGCFTLSRTYLLSMILIIVFMNIPFIKNKIGEITKIPIFGATGLLIISCFSLYFFGLHMQSLYLEGQIENYEYFFDRITHPYDFSNYFRFTVNVIEINVFNQYPLLWLFGCSRDEFLLLSHQYASSHGFWYRNNDPHNFVFSYIKLYGISGIISVFLSSHLISKNTNKNNYYMMMSLIIYPIFLSVGFNGVWLFMTVSVLKLYGYDCSCVADNARNQSVIQEGAVDFYRV